jgi:hypothetical protein
MIRMGGSVRAAGPLDALAYAPQLVKIGVRRLLRALDFE